MRAATTPIPSIGAPLSQRSRQIIRPNLKYRLLRAGGDSGRDRDETFCYRVLLCSTIRHLERTLSDILEGAC